MARLAFLALFVGLLIASSISQAQEDLWDSLMEQASEALRTSDLPAARKAAALAVRQGRYESAERYVTSLVLLARIAQDAGDLTAAEQALRQAIELIDHIPGPLQEDKAVLHNNLGALLDQAGDLSGAEQQYRAALALHRGVTALRSENRFSLLVNLAGLLERRNDQEGARRMYADAEILLPRLPPAASVTLNNNLGALLQRRGDFVAARDHLARALSVLPPEPGQPALRASLLHNLGTAELEAGELAGATQHLGEAEKIRRDRLGDRHIDTARTLSSVALLRERQGRRPEALGAAREASAIIAASLAASAGTRAAAASAQTRRDWRESFATHLRLLDSAESDGAQKVREALEILQTVKHGELARVFAGAALGGEGQLGERVRAIQQQSERFQSKEKELAAELQSATPNDDRERTARKDLAGLRDALERLQAELAQDFPSYHELVAGRIAPLGSVQSVLGPDEAVLVYFVAETESFAIAITSEAARLIRIPRNRADLTKTVMEIRRSAEPEHADESQFAFLPAHGLYRDLIAPLAALLDRKPVWLVVPDGPLESLPFSLLTESAIGSTRGLKWNLVPWVIRHHAVVTLPSLGAFTLARNSPAPGVAPEALIAFADPILNETPSTGAASRKARNLKIGALWAAERPGSMPTPPPPRASRSMTTTTASGKRLANPDLVRKLTPLPDTADEARAVAASLGGGELLMRDSATETNLKQRDLSRYRNLLFATHGAMASDFVEFGEPALVMTPPKVASDLDDGLLAASEIAQLKLNADWVLLSACNTAAADGTPGAEGLSGLAKAFFHAGARNLLVSHWSVVSESTVLLSTGAFGRLQQHPKEGKARALQHSILALMDKGEDFRHPMYWAPFVLVGDGH